jgi:hypothetical protein
MRTLLVAAALAAACTAPVALAAKPALRIADLTPLTLSGANFQAGERVLVRAEYAGDTTFRKAVATRVGRFTVTFPGIRVSRCATSDLEVLATGSRGSRLEFVLHHLDCSSR